MRLNKFIAHNSKYSRREADQLIKNGDVKIDKKVVKELATDIDEKSPPKILVKNQPIKKAINYTFIVYNKPKGELVTKHDPQGRKTIFHSLPTNFRGFSPVGRLDFASEGVLILGDRIDIVEKMMTSNLERVYKIKVDGAISKRVIQAMESGISIENSKGGHQLTEINSMQIFPFNWFNVLKSGRNYSTLKVSISEGKNRELRRFFAQFNLNILDLKRVSFGWVNLNALPTGKKRYFTKEEYEKLRDFFLGNKQKSSRNGNEILNGIITN